MAGGGGGRKFDQTATWVVFVVFFVMVAISLVFEKILHSIVNRFKKKKKQSMVDALDKIQTELMILGFISLFLVFTQEYLAKFCIPEKVANRMLPCKLRPKSEDYPKVDAGNTCSYRKHMIYDDDDVEKIRIFAQSLKHDQRIIGVFCLYFPGKVPFVSVDALHQLHLFIFFLAGYQVISSGLTMALGRLKIRDWKHWENETTSWQYEFCTDPTRLHCVQDDTFVSQHQSWWNSNAFFLYVVSFLRHLFRSVSKDDYLIMRHGFISAHLDPGRRINFQKYIKRSLEHDFKEVVGISKFLWATAGITLLLNHEGWHTMFWISLLPLITILAVGTKLQAIITRMSMEISDKNVIIQGRPLVSPDDRHFWFGKPHFALQLIHFTLFQNAFQLTYFLWILYKFGWNSCVHQNKGFLISRICIGVFVQLLCSYVTLPLYALVSQMGSKMKASSIFDEHTAEAVNKWRQGAKRNQYGRSAAHKPSTSPVGSPLASPDPLLHGHETTGNSAAKQDEEHDRPLPLQVNSSLRRRDLEMGSISPQEQPHRKRLEEYIKEDFSFGKESSPNNLRQ